MTPFGFPANLNPTFFLRTNICRIYDHDPLDQLNSNSCFLYRDTSVKYVSGELEFN